MADNAARGPFLRASIGSLASTTISIPAGDFPAGSQVARASSGHPHSGPFGPHFALTLSQRLTRLRLPSFELPQCFLAVARCIPARPLVEAPRVLARQLRASAFVAAPRALGCPLGGALLRQWPRFAVTFRVCTLSCRTPPGSNASGLAAVALSAPLAGLMLAVLLARAGAAFTAGNAPPCSFASAPAGSTSPRVCVRLCIQGLQAHL